MILLCHGRQRRILWGSAPNGRCRGKEYYDDLDERQQAKLDHTINRLADNQQVRLRERFIHERDGIYCIKSHGHRLAGFFDEHNDFVIVSGFPKKEDKGRRFKRNIDTAVNLMKHHADDQEGQA